MKSFLIIPMGGTGSRFLDAGYQTYKPFLPVDRQNLILDNIVKNFSNLKSEIIVLTNFKYLKKKNFDYLKKKKCNLINIPRHKKGPLYSIFLGLSQINKIIKKNKNVFICYSDINWIWNINKIKKDIFNSNAVVFTHTGFHPHLQVNSKSDFCKKLNGSIKDISEKKTFGKDYQKELLAIGCYYFKKIDFLNNFFYRNELQIKKEYYLTSLVKYLLKKKIKIKSININKFVHLGIPEQYEDFLKWKKYNFALKKKQKSVIKKKSTVMLMGGKGKRMSGITRYKPFILVNKTPIFKHIFNKLNSKEKIIITNNNLKKKINNKKFKILITKPTNSMFDTIYKNKYFISNKSNYFLTSCDCVGINNSKKLEGFLNKNKKDLVYFAFNFSYFQKKLGDSHSHIVINKKKINIKVKSSYRGPGYGHAGYFWIKNSKVFKFLDMFKNSSLYKSFKREILIDDYFKYLLDKKLISSNYYLLDDYIHIGSEKEYREYKYWDNYFNEKKYF